MTEDIRHGEAFARGLKLHRDGALREAVEFYRRAIAEAPDDPEAYNALGGALANLGETKAAVKALQTAIEKEPAFFDPHLHLATLWRLKGQPSRSEPLLRRALAINAESYPAWMELGAAMLLQHRFLEALECFEKALALAPGDAHALHNLGRTAMESGRPELAVTYYREALAQMPELAPCHTNLGMALRALGDFEGARKAYEQALKIEPGQAAAISSLVSLMELEGRYEDALALTEEAIAENDDPLLQLGAARIEGRLKRYDAAIARLESIEESDINDDVGMQRSFILGDLYDKKGAYETAWANYQLANQMKRAPFSAAEWSRRVDDIIAAFPADGAEMPVSKHSDDRPIFIVGMPRSGTSLVEQILASHADVYGAGELTTLASIVEEIPHRINGAQPYPRCMGALSARRLTRLGSAYLEKLDELAPQAKRVTDKMWQNFEYLGIIERMLPGARVIHCRRDPLDTGLSCYFQHFAGQAGVPFSYDLAHIGAYYRGYKRLMAHWRGRTALPVFELDYETLTGEPEPTIRALIKFVELPWDDACLNFHTNPRLVSTASAAQVREPVYTRSVARHRFYEKHLGPLREALGL